MPRRNYFGICAKCACLAALALLCAPLVRAQDQPLGDVARQAREQRANAPHAAKVVTNDSDNPASAVNPEDPPPEVVRKAAIALRHDANHSCSLRSNSGPGSSTTTNEDVAFGNQFHITVNDSSGTLAEWIVIGGDTYRKLSIAPWQKLDAHDPDSAVSQKTPTLPQALIFPYSAAELKLIRKDSINGAAVLVYGYTAHSVEMTRTIQIWVESDDNLPIRTDMHTVTQSPGRMAPIVWDEHFSCSYGTVKKIDPPL
jgi:hypothetical protein